MKKISSILIVLVIIITALLYFTLPKEQNLLSLTLGASLLLGTISIITTLYNNNQIDHRNRISQIESTRPRFLITEKSTQQETIIKISYDCPKILTLDKFLIEIENGEDWDDTNIALSRVENELSKHNGKLLPNRVLEFKFPNFPNNKTFLDIVKNSNNEMKLKISCLTYYDEKISYYLGHNLDQHYVKFSDNKATIKTLEKNLKLSFYKNANFSK
ncbi:MULTISPECIES: hypothetical protein [unclassified Staphylococcus]|uniref:hypothetical protein n=1 Tax=unclassified Staphylococcus TaxID=91994 RepID=UPI001AEC68FF|nr:MULTISPECIES: hypothetical protein [unclassified Staphylococcus]